MNTTAAIAVIPAAGQGARFTNAQWPQSNKLFAPLLGVPILRWSAEALASHPDIDQVIIVARADEFSRCKDICSGIDNVIRIVSGGATRQESVAKGLSACDCQDDTLILVHDGARPLLSHDVIDRCLTGAEAHGNAVAAVPVVDTLKAVDATQTVTRTVDRSSLWSVQTPQCFSSATLKAAHRFATQDVFSGTDEASLVEHHNQTPVHLVMGASDNLKITRPEDIAIAEAVLRARTTPNSAACRVGFGYDIHRLAPGRRLVLGGLEIPNRGIGLDGHSDADVLLHALMDALLGAAALPDIGHLFPNTDPKYEGANSCDLLSEVASRVQTAGFAIVNIDMTLVAEAPLIGPYLDRMRAVISERLSVLASQVGIKATTHEGLGALGAGLGIAAHAVASLTPISGG